VSIFSELANMLGGDIFKTLTDTVKAYWPPTMSDTEKAQAEVALINAKSAAEAQMNGALAKIQETYESRIRDLEGTAADLKTIPIIGPIVIFLRGCQRPIWGFAVLWMDYCVYSGTWNLIEGSKQEACFYVINLLVLGFLFGERAIQNLMPLIERIISTSVVSKRK